MPAQGSLAARCSSDATELFSLVALPCSSSFFKAPSVHGKDSAYVMRVIARVLVSAGLTGLAYARLPAHRPFGFYVTVLIPILIYAGLRSRDIYSGVAAFPELVRRGSKMRLTDSAGFKGRLRALGRVAKGGIRGTALLAVAWVGIGRFAAFSGWELFQHAAKMLPHGRLDWLGVGVGIGIAVDLQEIIFRRFALGRLAQRFEPWTANILQSILFVAAHFIGNIIGGTQNGFTVSSVGFIPIYFVTGLIQGRLFLRKGYATAWLAHFLFNLIFQIMLVSRLAGTGIILVLLVWGIGITVKTLISSGPAHWKKFIRIFGDQPDEYSLTKTLPPPPVTPPRTPSERPRDRTIPPSPLLSVLLAAG